MFPTIDFSPERFRQQGVQQQLLDDAIGLFSSEGCLLIRNLLNPEFIEELHQLFLRQKSNYFQDKEFADALWVGDKRTMITVEISGRFNSSELYANPLVFALVKKLMGNQVLLGTFGAVNSLPGAKNQHIHRDLDNAYEQLNVPGGVERILALLPPYAITLFIPLVPFNAANGTTRMWPGSHLVTEKQAFQMSYIDPVVDIGDCILMDYRLLHCGTANNSGNVRPLLYLTYRCPGFTDKVNFSKQAAVQISSAEYSRVPSEYQFLFRETELS
ncbi:MAG: phytanoyl-CoA dioxygenase family protein [Gammaproteobacteria bacterium]|nr:phytanoyl-CoA dioxygenase family protein [Gammaproteobacteria bacterium]